MPDRSDALDHIVVVLFENRSLDNVLGHLYGPGDGKNFEGVIGKDLSNPIPEWADAETLFERLEAHGKTWKVYISEPMQISFTGIIHHQRLKDRLATHFVPFAQFEADAAKGTLPDFSLIEPGLTIGHNDYHPAEGRALGHGVVVSGFDSPSSILGGEAFLARIYDAYRGMRSDTGSNVWNTTLHIGWDEPGGTYDHVPPPAVPPPDPPDPADPAAPAGEYGFTFDRSDYRVPAIVISPWVAEGQVFNQEHRHTSLIAKRALSLTNRRASLGWYAGSSQRWLGAIVVPPCRFPQLRQVCRQIELRPIRRIRPCL